MQCIRLSLAHTTSQQPTSARQDEIRDATGYRYVPITFSSLRALKQTDSSLIYESNLRKSTPVQENVTAPVSDPRAGAS